MYVQRLALINESASLGGHLEHGFPTQSYKAASGHQEFLVCSEKGKADAIVLWLKKAV